MISIFQLKATKTHRLKTAWMIGNICMRDFQPPNFF